MQTNLGGTVRRAGALLALSSLALVSCGGKSSTTTTVIPTPTDAGATTVVPSTTQAAPASTAGSTTTGPPVPWKDLAQPAVAQVSGAVDGTVPPMQIAHGYFSLPVEVAIPDDARLSGAYLRVEQTDTGLAARWDLRFSSAQAAEVMESAAKQSFSDARFVEGVRVVSELKDGNYVTLNYPATAEGESAGWGLMNVTIGPQVGADGPTGRTEMIVAVERTVAGIGELGLTPFLTAWESEMPPLREGAAFAEFTADLTRLQTNGVWLEYTYHAPSSAFEALVKYYAQDLSAGDLVLEDSSEPGDLTTTEYYSAGFFPTLAGFTVDVTVERTLSDPAQPAVVRYRVRVEPPATSATDTAAATTAG